MSQWGSRKARLVLAALLGMGWIVFPAGSETGVVPALAAPGVIIDYRPASTGIYIGSPSLAMLSRTEYVAAHDEFGPNSTEFTAAVTRVFASRDRGESWTNIARIDGQFWSTLFAHRGALYLLGTDKHHGHVIVRRSRDGGRTWTSPMSAATGRLRAEAEYHCAPAPVLEHGGRLWRAFEHREPPTGWGITYCAGVLSAPVEADLLDAANWTASNFVPGDAKWLDGSFGGWLEGNAVQTPSGGLVDLLRVDTPGLPEKAALVAISTDGKAATFDAANGFIDFPGGAKKFTVRFDAPSKRYWSVASISEPPDQNAGRPGAVRNTLALTCSPDLRQWTIRRILLHHGDSAKHGFQYVDWLFDDEDIIAVCRTAYDDGEGGAHNYHDANYLTFHRVTKFRATALSPMTTTERQITHARTGHLLTNTGVWSPDSEWIAYDTRSDAAGAQFDGERIEMVNVRTGEIKTLFEAANGAHCGVVTFHPRENRVAFILGPENPTPDWQYNAYHRQGVVVEVSRPGHATNLDARDLVPPFTPGALRGGSHVHVWDAAGQWVSFTYEDHVLSRFGAETAEHETNLRNVGVSVPGKPVRVPRTHPRNHDGAFFTVLVTRTTADPDPGSDQISRACEEGWVGTNGYARGDGRWQRHALAFQGQVLTGKRESIAEVFIVDLPDDLTVPGDGPLAGTETRRPFPPRGVRQRRLTHTANRRYPGLQGPRHWLRSAPDGARIAFLMKDDAGIAQLWTISPNGGAPAQLTHNPWPIGSAFTWSPDGRYVAHTMDNSVCVTETAAGKTTRLTARSDDATAPRPEACVFSPDRRKIAFVRRVEDAGQWFNQIFVAFLPDGANVGNDVRSF